MNDDQEQQVSPKQALATGLISIETSRRVGWAKAISGKQRIDDLEKQVALLQSEIRAMREIYIRLIGFASALPHPSELFPGSPFEKELDRHKQAAAGFWDKDAYRAGRNLAIRFRHKIRRHAS